MDLKKNKKQETSVQLPVGFIGRLGPVRGFVGDADGFGLRSAGYVAVWSSSL